MKNTEKSHETNEEYLGFLKRSLAFYESMAKVCDEDFEYMLSQAEDAMTYQLMQASRNAAKGGVIEKYKNAIKELEEEV